jgi:hypothetical protein
VQQINGESQCFDGKLNEYQEKCLHLLNRLESVSVGHVPQEENKKANMLAQQASSYNVRRGQFEVRHRHVTTDMVLALEGNDRELAEELAGSDWRKVLVDHITNLSHSRDKKVRRQAIKYTLIDGKLHRRTIEGLLLKCLSEEEAKVAMGEVHEGMCGAH